MRAHWHHTANMIEIVLPSAYPSPQPKQQIDRFSRFCTAHSRKSLYFIQWPLLSPNFPFTWGIWTPSNTIPWAHPSLQPNRHLNWFSRFCTDDRRVSLYFTKGHLFPLKIALPVGVSGPPSNTWLPGPTWVLNPNSISIGWAIFAGLTSVTDRLTDRPTDHATWSVTTGHIYIHSTAIWPNNKKGMHTKTKRLYCCIKHLS